MRMISGKPARLAALMRSGVGGGQFPLQSIGTASMVLGACLLNPGSVGIESPTPVGDPDAADQHIRFDVKAEAFRPSLVARFPWWRSSPRCECGEGRSPPLSELQDIVGEADEAPFGGDLLDAPQEELTEAARLLDLSEHRLGQLLS